MIIYNIIYYYYTIYGRSNEMQYTGYNITTSGVY